MSPVNDPSSESSDGSASSDGSSSEDEHQEPPAEPEVKVEPESKMKWNLSVFIPGGIQKSPNEAPLSHEPVESVKAEEHDEEDGEIQRTPSDHYQNENSNSSIPDNKSDVSQEQDDHRSMPPPAKVKSPSKTPDKIPDGDLNSVLNFINILETIQPISSISDSDDNDTDRRQRKRSKKKRPEVDGDNSSSDESSRFSESRRRSSMDEKKPRRVKVNSLSLPPPVAMPPQNPYEATHTSSDTNSTNGTKKTHKSPRKEPQSRKATNNRRRPSQLSVKKSREMIPSSDGSSDEAETTRKPPKPAPVKAKAPTNHHPAPVKKPSKKKQPKVPEKIESPIASSSDSESERRPKHSRYQSPAAPSSSSTDHSDSDASSRPSKKIEKIVSDKNKKDMLSKLFNVTKVSEGGKGGKGGAKGKGQVVVITPEDAQNQSKSNESTASSNGAVSVQNPKYLSPSSAFNTAAPSVIVRIDLSRINLSRLNIAEKLKNTVIRTKSPAVPIEQPRKSKKRMRSSNHDEQDRWRHHANSNKNFDQLSVSSSSSASSSSATSFEQHPMENPAARVASFTTNYNNDRLNNNIDHHKTTKDISSFYHSPSSVDTKLPKIKRESNAYKEFGGYSMSPMKDSKTNDFTNKIKQEVKDESDGAQEMRKRASSMTNSSHTFKEKKRKRPDGASDNSLPMPPTNHERLPMSGLANGDLVPTKMEEVKKVYVSYFERTNDEVEQAEAR